MITGLVKIITLFSCGSLLSEMCSGQRLNASDINMSMEMMARRHGLT